MAPDQRHRDSDTIAAVATPPGAGAIGIIRLSGPQAIAIAGRIFRGERKPLEMKGYEAAHGWIVRGDEKLDEVVLLVMRAPKSYTREDMVEISCHGGPVVLSRVLEAAVAEGARIAEPGEFTRRAFLSGRIDLAQAEAVAALISSRTEAAARAALRGLCGELSEKIRELNASLVQLLAELEAGLDFAEDDIEFLSREQLLLRLEAVRDELAKLVRRGQAGKILSEGVRLVIAGRPNAGKSTLMNALLQKDRVLVAETPGTTRDVVEDSLNLQGVPIRIADTAGLRENPEPIENKAAARTRRALAEADLVLLLIDRGQPLAEDDRILLAETRDRPRIILLNKSDLAAQLDIPELKRLLAGEPVLEISAKTGQGLPELREGILEQIRQGRAASEDSLVASQRQLELLGQCRDSIEKAVSAAKDGLGEELVAADLRKAVDRLGQISGEAVSGQILELIFSRFCIGK